MQNLDYRGLTIPGNIIYKTKILLGPEAFVSWGILGSTLAHEIEIHCKQNVYLIILKDLLNLDGTKYAEREAYSHEINNKERFNLTDEEVNSIEEVMNQFYSL